MCAVKRKNEARWVQSRSRWQINVQAEGSRRTFTSSKPGTKGKIEAEKKADSWLEHRVVNENTKVSSMLERYTAHLEATTSPSHYRQYDSHIRLYIDPVIGAKKIGRLTKADLQQVIDSAYQKSTRNPEKKLSEKSLKNIRGCLISFVTYCREAEATTLYPGKLKIPTGAKKPAKTILMPDELTTLFTVSTTVWRQKRREDFFIHAYRFQVLTGLRVGEIVGLLRSNISDGRMTITQAINDDGDITPGKNDNARRSQALGELALAELAEQEAMLKGFGGISKYVFPQKDMAHISQENYRRAWKRYCKANGIEHATTPYELRHTFVSVNDEMPAGLKKMVVGHSASMDTEGIYGHERQDARRRAAKYVDSAFKAALGRSEE